MCDNDRAVMVWWRPGVVLAVVVLFVNSSICWGQEVSSLQWAIRTEGALVSAIAKAEPSVVALARVRTALARPIRREPLGGPIFPRVRHLARPQPGDPNFVPDEFATAVVIDAKGLLLTNYHALGDLNDAEAEYQYYVTTKDRRTYRAEIVAADPRSDLAVLKIAPTRRLTPIVMGSAAGLRKGRMVITLGNPYAIARDGQASASLGIVANIARKAGSLPSPRYSESKPTLHHFGTLIQTDAKLSLGTSGGPLLNLKDEMIGLTTSVAALVGYEKSSGYAVPVDETFRRIVKALSNGQEIEYGFLGI
jgi:serine protease Do